MNQTAEVFVNRLTGFKFENNVAHGAVVEISMGVDEMLGQRDYAPQVRALISEALAAMPLLATHLRFEGRINLQFQGEGALKMLVAQVDHHLEVRAMAKVVGAAEAGFAGLLHGGVLALMLEPNGEQRAASQATVPIEGESLAESLEGYFNQSEQLPTLIRLAADGERLRGFMLQRLPLEDARGNEEDWERLAILASTLGPVQVSCRCARAGISRLLLSLGREECDSILAEQGRISVTCEFCGRDYAFSKEETAELFVAAGSVPSNTRH
jgi:molecular chaperone Hsp33